MLLIRKALYCGWHISTLISLGKSLSLNEKQCSYRHCFRNAYRLFVMWLGQSKAQFLSCVGKVHLQGESAESTVV